MRQMVECARRIGARPRCSVRRSLSWFAAALGVGPAAAAAASEPPTPALPASGLYEIAERWHEAAELVAAPRGSVVQPCWAWVSRFPEWRVWHQAFLAPDVFDPMQLSLPVATFDTRAFFAPAEHRVGLAPVGVGVLGGSRGGGYLPLRPAARTSLEPCFGACTPSDGASVLRRQARELGNLTTFASGVGMAGLGTTAALYWAIGDMSRHPSDAPLEIYTIGGPSGAGLFVRQPF
jgi:hypothetical protein